MQSLIEMQPRQCPSGSKIAIISPHLDDAVLSCFNHMQKLVLYGMDITVINVFSRYENQGIVSPFCASFMADIGCSSPQKYEEIRKNEDLRALEILGIKSVCLDFVDAGFRGSNGQATYEAIFEVFQGSPNKFDYKLVDVIANKFSMTGSFSAVYVPLGIGMHIDHLISRIAAERVWGARQRFYYADMPYALRPWKWRRKNIEQIMHSKLSVKWTSQRKTIALKCYATQIPYLLPYGKQFPEIVCYF